MSSLLDIGARALLANQIALATTGNNISNANTTGYSRQTAVMTQMAGQYTGSGYIGNGVGVSTIERAHSDFLTAQAAQAQSVAAMDSTRADKLSSLEDVFQSGDSGLGSAMNAMLNAFSDVATTPTDTSARSVVITQANETAARFNNAQQQIDDLQQSVNSELGDSVKTINDLASRLANLNQQIQQSQGSGQSPNDLLDQRDEMVRELDQQVKVSTVTADDGSMSVFVGSQALVLGSSAAPVTLVQGAGNTSQLALTRGSLTSTIDGNTVGGGTVAGLLRFQNTDLEQARNGLGRMALALATTVNAQNRLGVDLNGNAGGDFFQPITIPDATGATTNTGNAVVGATVSDASSMVASSYQVQFGTGGSVAVTRLSDGKVTNFAGPMPVTIDGLQLDVESGTAAAGDSFTLKPYATAAGDLTTTITSPAEVAAASPVQAAIGSTNTGSLAVGNLAATSSDPNLNATVTLTFNGSGGFDVSGTGTGNPTGVAYTAGQAISYNGWSLTLNGTPKAGDTITVQAASAGYSNLNSGNATALMNLRDKTMFDGAPMSDGYAALIADVGVRSQSAQYASTVSTSIATDLETQRTSVSGVNLDEEASKLLQYQQAYQASAKMIQVAQTLFDSMLQSMS